MAWNRLARAGVRPRNDTKYGHCETAAQSRGLGAANRECRVVIAVNGRFLRQRVTGVQRYARMVMQYPPRTAWRYVEAPARAAGTLGHAWEQLILPARLRRGELLWSPCNVGPLAWSKQVVTIHDVVPLDHPEWMNPRMAAWYRLLIPRLCRRVRHVITVSEYSKRRLVEAAGADEARVSVVPNGVDEAFLAAREHRNDAAEARRVPFSRYVLSVGSLEPRKNLGRLLDAWRQALPSLPEDVGLVLSGSVGSRRVFRDAGLGELPARVHLAGYTPDEALPGLYAGAEVFVYPSLYEGFGLPPLEALATGTPVIVSDIPPLREVVGAHGTYVDPGSTEDLVAALRSAFEQDDREGADGRRRYAEGFSWRRTADRTWSIIEAAAS